MFKVGDYVKVIAIADPWEGGDSDDDRQTYIGHVGVITEVDAAGCYCDTSVPDDTIYLTRFPNQAEEHITGQRWFEERVLELVSSPAVPISHRLFDECF